MDYSFLELWAKKGAWCMWEAALLVNEIDPTSPTKPTFEPQSTSRPSAVLVWLKKEFNKGALHPVDEKDGEPLFSPGTLVRRLVERKKFWISSLLREALDRPEGAPGPSKQNLQAIVRFRHAAQLIWADYPDLSAEAMSAQLVMLPSFATDPLPPMSKTTIRKYLRGQGHHKAGRPSKSSQIAQQIDLASYGKKI